MKEEKWSYLLESVCCEAPVIGVEFDSVDGDYGVPYVVGHGQCSDCHEWSRFA